VQWDRLATASPQDCRHRSRVEHGPDGESATCGLIREALSLADEPWSRVSRDSCLTCCRGDPATPAAWSEVVTSLVYQAAAGLAATPDGPPEVVAQAAAARDRAADRLTFRGVTQDGARPPLPQFDRLEDVIPPPRARRRRPIKTWAVGVTTSPRRRPTLERCLDHLTRAGWEAPHLFMDGPVRVPERFGHLPGTLREPAAGAWPNHYLALFELTLRQPSADAYLILQDDALIYDGENVRAYLERTFWFGGAAQVVSLYCAEPYTAAKFGWHRFRKAWVWGALAFAFSRDAAQRYLRDGRVCRHRWRSPDGGLVQIDVLIGWWAKRRRIPVWFPTPSLVQHIGETSTLCDFCVADGPRAAGLFIGKPSAGQE
jgi:hypothetical protein